ncbi:MAG: hypothetical protein OXI80_08425 [Caldilineaceae bacterium]|nr:hypothetical protein [Caldilineaceae bacterium]MDE0337683.1 hypothetical protein [Caldilineaceae bacterium]
MRITSDNVAKELLDFTAGKRLEAWLREQVGIDLDSDSEYWRNVGDQRSNAGPIEASADEINPLVERIVNSMEAVIELRVAECKTIPNNPRDAIEKLFNVPEGDCSRLERQEAQEVARHVSVTFRGDSRNVRPTLEVRDKGIGVHPSNFADSILALGQSDKGQKPYLVGMYGQGGSSTFDKCEYTVIVSRRHPKHLSPGQDDEAGWTVVKRSLNVRAPVYKYLIDPETGSVPVLSGSTADQIGLNYGTIIVHIEYRNTGGFATQEITNSAFYTLNYRLFNPLLTWTLSDRRKNANVSRTMRGIPYRVTQLPAATGLGANIVASRNESTSVRHHMQYEHLLSSGANLKVEWWILQDERIDSGRKRPRHDKCISPYQDRTRRYSRRVIAVTRGGQTHAALTSNIFANKRLRQLSRSVIVQVDSDSMTYEEGASFFASNRAELKTASQDQVEEAVAAAIDLHIDKLRAIEREREQEIVSGRGASDEDRIRKHLDPMIRAFRQRHSRQGFNTDLNQRRGHSFRGKKIPTFLRFARKNPLEIRPGVPTFVDLLTDAVDKTVRDRRTILQTDSSQKDFRLSSPEGTNGRFRVRLFPPSNLFVGTEIELNAFIARPGVWHVNADQPCRLIVVAPPPPYEGKYPPTLFHFRSQNGAIRVRQGGARITVVTDAPNDIAQNGATLSIVSPDPQSIPVLGTSGPQDGELRIGLRVPEHAPLGAAGRIAASLTLSNGTSLKTSAELIVDPSNKRGGQTDFGSQPNYDIRDVTEIRDSEDGVSWSDMATILGIDDHWNGEDVGAYVETGEEAERKVVFYLNADNRHLKDVEKKIVRRQSENAVDNFREMHRSLLCLHLYKLSTRNENEDDPVYSYRDEMIRVSETLLFTREEFMTEFETEE